MRVLVLKGDGLNCERESAAAFIPLGLKVDIRTVKELLHRPAMLLEYKILVLPGGFSFGDELQSGHILGLALSHALGSVWEIFLKKKSLVLGVCNGFQTLMKMGVFEEKRTLALVHNQPHGFQNRWVRLNVHASPCVWTQDLEGRVLNQPIRHGEGRIWSATTKTSDLKGKIVLTYQDEVNGSLGRIAGLTDTTGQIFGLMPHPEAALNPLLFPESADPSSVQLNQKLFLNAFQFIQESHHAVAY